MKTLLGRLAFLALLVLPQQTFGCTIPVYRYALERWELATYDVLVFHRGALPEPLAAEVARWQQGGKANLDITTVDLDGKLKPELEKIWKAQGDKATLPWLVVQAPNSTPQAPPAWS